MAILRISEDKINWKKLLWELLILIVIAGALFGWGAWVGYKAHPSTKTIKITGNPTTAQQQKADIVVGQTNQGHATASIPMTPIGDNNHSLIGFQNDPWGTPHGLFNSSDGLSLNGWTGRGELKGDVQTTITDKRSGKILWSGSSPLSGEAMATINGDQLDLDLTFLNNQTYAIDLPESKPKRLEVGAVAGISTNGEWFAGGYGRCNITTINIGRFEASPWIGVAGVQTNDGPEGVAMVGISGRF